MALKTIDSFGSGNRPVSSRNAISPKSTRPSRSFARSKPRTSTRSGVVRAICDRGNLRVTTAPRARSCDAIQIRLSRCRSARFESFARHLAQARLLGTHRLGFREALDDPDVRRHFEHCQAYTT